MLSAMGLPLGRFEMEPLLTSLPSETSVSAAAAIMPWVLPTRKRCPPCLKKDGAAGHPCSCPHHSLTCGMARETRPPSSTVSCPRTLLLPCQVAVLGRTSAKGLYENRMAVEVSRLYHHPHFSSSPRVPPLRVTFLSPSSPSFYRSR